LLHIIPLSQRDTIGYQKILSVFFHLTNVLLLFAMFADFVYFEFTLKRSTADALSMIILGGDFIRIAPFLFLDFWYLTLLWLVFIWLGIVMYRRVKVDFVSSDSGGELDKNVRGGWVFQSVLLLISLLAIVIGGRGGLQLVPIGIINAGFYTTPRNLPLVLNTPFSVITTFGKQNIDRVEYLEPNEADNAFSPVHQYHSQDTITLAPINVVVFIMESFSAEYSSFFNGGEKGYTPNLDSLARNGLAFTNCYANGKKSIEAIPAILAGLPTLMDNPYLTSSYAGNKMNGLAAHLGRAGYASSFYHGGTNGTMAFDAFAKMSGFESYYGRSEYNNEEHYDGMWGIYDEVFLSYMARGLSNTKEPFLSCLVSLSSHHPYFVPEKYEGKFDKGDLPIHESIGYADFCLKTFFNEVSKQAWFDNTLFVITADHTEKPLGDFYNNQVGIYHIPLLFYHPNGNFKGIEQATTQQTDIMPSILDYVGYTGKFLAFGNSVFDREREPFSVSFLNGLYQIVSGDYAQQFDGESITGLFNIREDVNLKNSLVDQQPEVAENMKRKLQGLIQSYNQRLIENKITVE